MELYLPLAIDCFLDHCIASESGPVALFGNNIRKPAEKMMLFIYHDGLNPFLCDFQHIAQRIGILELMISKKGNIIYVEHTISVVIE